MATSTAFDYNKFYDTYYRKCYVFAKSYIHDDLAAMDIASESLIKLWEVSKFQTLESAPKLLFEISKNKCLDYLKHEKIKRSAMEEMSVLADKELEFRISTLECSDTNKIFAADIHSIIEKTLSQLPEQTRLIFEEYRFQGKEKQEIAKKYNISVKGVDYHLSKALQILRIALKDYSPIIIFLIFNRF